LGIIEARSTIIKVEKGRRRKIKMMHIVLIRIYSLKKLMSLNVEEVVQVYEHELQYQIIELNPLLKIMIFKGKSPNLV